MSSSSIEEKRSTEKTGEGREAGGSDSVEVSVAAVDTGAILAAGMHGELDPDEAVKLRFVHDALNRC